MTGDKDALIIEEDKDTVTVDQVKTISPSVSSPYGISTHNGHCSTTGSGYCGTVSVNNAGCFSHGGSLTYPAVGCNGFSVIPPLGDDKSLLNDVKKTLMVCQARIRKSINLIDDKDFQERLSSISDEIVDIAEEIGYIDKENNR